MKYVLSHICFAIVLIARTTRKLTRIVNSWVFKNALRTEGINIPPGSHISLNGGVSIAHGFYAHGPVWIDAIREYEGKSYNGTITIGSSVRVSNGLHITSISNINIGNCVLFGSNVLVTDHSHGGYGNQANSDPRLAPALRPLSDECNVVVGSNVWVGDNVVILAGARIGDGCVVASGSLVKGTLPEFTVCAGVPARVIKQFDLKDLKWKSIAKA